MFLDLTNFTEIIVNLDEVFLDPNNPRFSDEKEVMIDESKIMDKKVQSNAIERMKKYGLNRLIESIKNVGFLKIDRIVVRKIRGEDKKYVVVEGNRRIAALKIINNAYEDSELSESREVIIKSIKIFEALLYEGEEEDISWIIQGIRHISGVRPWKPFQQAQLIVTLVSDRWVSSQEASETLGIGPRVAARLIRAYYAYRQAEDDEEFGTYITPKHFAYFFEVVFRSPALRKWLEWDDDNREFSKTDQLRQYLSWFVSTEENEDDEEEEKLKVKRAQDMRDIVAKSMINEPDLFRKFALDDEMNAEKLQFELGKRSRTDEIEWFDKIVEFTEEINDLPTIKILERKEEFIEILTNLIEILQKHVDILEKM